MDHDLMHCFYFQSKFIGIEMVETMEKILNSTQPYYMGFTEDHLMLPGVVHRKKKRFHTRYGRQRKSRRRACTQHNSTPSCT
uniref:Ovule protein n=1 Tax=Heterorhabditis bacteriophora TaxID=37862 RepID=A0A1I7XAT6_HETBA